MKILVIGSEGFIGSKLCNYFYEMGMQVWGADIVSKIDQEFYSYTQLSKDKADWDYVFALERFDYCINAAGKGDVSFSIDQPLKDFKLNVLELVRILDAIRYNDYKLGFIHISSAAIYGNPKQLPVKETDQPAPLSPYGFHKLMSEEICKEYHSIYKIPIAIVRPFSVFGPGLKKQLLWDAYQKYLNSKNELELWGTGNESRDFIFIDDLARALHTILASGKMEGEVYNIASGIETTIKEVITKLFALLDNKTAIKFNNQSREGDPLNWKADISRIRELGFEPETSLDKGLEMLVNWLRTQD